MIKSCISSLIIAFSVLLTPIAAAEKPEGSQAIEVNINQADAEEFDKYLDGVGEKKAQAIIDYRDKHGQFKSVEGLTNVKGIGPGLLEKIKKN